MIRKNAIQILEENKGSLSLYDYFEQCRDNDPKFFNWLFGGLDNTEIGDFGTNMNKQELEEYLNFERSVRAYAEIQSEFEL